ncbi:hypothetical protein G7K_3244-t1 [Saitoella complicata NRRL Y-17804]|uniref:VWFA domain-containing protein n=1 Tax=Saitoella complicata (strain BCRC 22490 / CBS 7301 / JCM 7358 / NBRC 10748 / NRRL Y-17804) TaxID=698492 RepID=A0A0E9NHD3_SAICN|nr:hypothetical protein G7K_3244-t1 [Saitoella complicata NRRL Y-17804]
MGLANKLNAAKTGAPAAGGMPPAAAGAPQQSYGAAPTTGYNPYAAQQQPPAPAQGGYGQPQPPQYGQPGSQNPQQYGTTTSVQQPGYNAGSKPPQYGAPQGQGQYGAPQGAPQGQGYGAPPGQYGSGYAPQPQGEYNQYRPPVGPPPGQQQQPPYGAPPQGQYGAPPGPPPSQQYGGGGGGANKVVADNLRRLVRENKLEMFYPPQRLEQVIARASSIPYQQLSANWGIPAEIAYDLAGLALYDVVIYCDDSGSMRAEEGGERVDDLKLILGRVADVTQMFDDDGITIRFMNSRDVQGDNVKSSAQAQSLVDRVRFSGITPLATQLDAKVLQPLVLGPLRSRGLPKPVLIITITDGEPVGEPKDRLKQVILSAHQQIVQSGFSPGAIAFQFAQVGKDMRAQAFLSELDRDQRVGSLVDAISYYELEAEEMSKKGVELTPELWLVKLCVGGIDSSYDEQDE